MNDPQAALSTPRLQLEPMLPAHAVKLYPLLRDPELYRYLGIEPPLSLGALEARYAGWSSRCSPDGSQAWLNWAARLRDTGDYAGWFQATVFRGGRADIAYMIFAPFRRRGLAIEACRAVIGHLQRDLGAGVVGATVDRRNLPSIELAKRLGMKRVIADPPTRDLRFEL